jgi:hypothetical protein
VTANRILDAAEVDRKKTSDRGKSRQRSISADRRFPPQARPQTPPQIPPQISPANSTANSPANSTANSTAVFPANFTAGFPRLQITSVPVEKRINPREQFGRPRCLAALEALLEQVCKRSATKGGEG